MTTYEEHPDANVVIRKPILILGHSFYDMTYLRFLSSQIQCIQKNSPHLKGTTIYDQLKILEQL